MLGSRVVGDGVSDGARVSPSPSGENVGMTVVGAWVSPGPSGASVTTVGAGVPEGFVVCKRLGTVEARSAGESVADGDNDASGAGVAVERIEGAGVAFSETEPPAEGWMVAPAGSMVPAAEGAGVVTSPTGAGVAEPEVVPAVGAGVGAATGDTVGDRVDA